MADRSEDDILGTKAASEILGISSPSVARLCREGKFPHASQDGEGHPWHIPRKDIDNYTMLKQRKTQAKKSFC